MIRLSRGRGLRTLAPAAAVVVLGLTAGGCGDDGGGGGGGGSGSPDRVAFVPGVQGDAFFGSTVCGAKAAAKELNIDLEVQVPPQFSAAAQNPILNGLLAKRPKAMIVFPDDPTGVTATLKRAMSQGVKVLTLSADIEDKSARDANVAIDLSVGGATAARNLAEEIGEKGEVFVMNIQPGISSTDSRQRGFEEEIKKYPGIKYLGAQFNNNDPTRAASIMSAQLKAHPQLKGVYATNLFGGQGAAAALKRDGKVGDVKLIAHDTAPQQVRQLRAGDVQGLIGSNAFQFGYQAVVAARNVLDGKEPGDRIPQEEYIDLENLDDPKIQQENVYKESC